MGAEGAFAITAGILAGSIALIGFGIDSAIEGVASLIIVWRFTGSRLFSEHAERRAQKLVAVLAYPSRRFESAWMGIIVHSAQSVVLIVIVLTLVLG